MMSEPEQGEEGWEKSKRYPDRTAWAASGTRWREFGTGSGRERENLNPDAKAKVTSGKTTRTKVPTQDSGTEEPVVAFKVSVMEMNAKGFYRLKETWDTHEDGRNP